MQLFTNRSPSVDFTDPVSTAGDHNNYKNHHNNNNYHKRQKNLGPAHANWSESFVEQDR